MNARGSPSRSGRPDRRRGHLALLATVLAVSAWGYFLIEPRTVEVLADGRTIVFETHQSNNAAVLGVAGIEINHGDRVTALDGAGTDVLRVDRARDLILRADGSEYRVRTHASTIEQALEEAGIALSERDSVLRDGALASPTSELDPTRLPPATAARGGPITVDVRRAVTFTVVDRGREIVSTTSRPTVAQALREAGVVVGPGDRVSPDMEAVLDADVRIDVAHAQAVTLALPDDHRVLYTFAGTVADVLDEAAITLPAGAFVHPSPDTAVSDGMSVRVVQLSSANDVETEYLASSTVYRVDPSLGPGESRTEQGRDGALVRRYEVNYVDGEEAGRTLIEEVYEPEPQDTVVYYPPQRGATESAPTAGTATTMTVYATWYNPASAGRPATDPNYGRTATGVLVTYGVVAVDPNVIPLGTRMFIPGYGYGVAADTGGAVKGAIIDLGYPDGVDVNWRSGWIEISILS